MIFCRNNIKARPHLQKICQLTLFNFPIIRMGKLLRHATCTPAYLRKSIDIVSPVKVLYANAFLITLAKSVYILIQLFVAYNFCS